MWVRVPTGGDVQVTRSSNLAQWAEPGTVVYTSPSGYTDVWAPELHYINGQFYIYVAMAQNGDNASHHVLQGMSTTDPLQRFNVCLSGPFVFGRLLPVGLTIGKSADYGVSFLDKYPDSPASIAYLDIIDSE